MDHDQRVCPRCGAPAGDYRFCPSCRSHLESLTGVPARAAAAPAEADATLQSPGESVRLEQALVRLEQAMAAASRMSGARSSDPALAAAVEVEDSASPRSLPPTTSDRSTDLRLAPRDFARLEDVLTVAPRTHETIAEAPRAVAAPEVAPATEEPSYVEAQALREAFWFEQASARLSVADTEAGVESQAAPSEAAPPQAAPAEAEHRAGAAEAEHRAEPQSPPSVVRLWSEPASRSGWATALCLLALLTLVALLSGRAPRRARGQ